MPHDLSIVIARADAAEHLDGCLSALARACEGLAAEILVVQHVSLPPFEWRGTGIAVRTLRVDGRALVPQLWAMGARAAKGNCVAFTLAACEVTPGWARAMTDALRTGAAGVAGPIECPPDAPLLDRATYYLRYSAFLPSLVADEDVRGEIPGDNAAYHRDALLRHADALSDGFWEVLFHRELRREGGRLCTRRAAVARFTGGVTLMRIVRHRFAHGRHFGAWRVAARSRAPWQIVAAAPLVPVLLAARAAARVARSPGHEWRFVAALPIFVLVASAWAAGEAAGALWGANLPSVHLVEERARQATSHGRPVASRD